MARSRLFWLTLFFLIVIVSMPALPTAAQNSTPPPTSLPPPPSPEGAVGAPGEPMGTLLPGYAPRDNESSTALFGTTSAAPQAATASCAALLANPTLDLGANWISVEPFIGIDGGVYTSPPNAFRIGDGDDRSRFPFADTSDAFGQAFVMPNDTGGVLIQFNYAYFAPNLFDRVYYAFHLVDPFGNLVYPAVGVGQVPLHADNNWHTLNDPVITPVIIDPLRGQRVALVIFSLTDALLPLASTWIDDVQVTACQGDTTPQPTPSPPPGSNTGATIDSGFRPNPDGYSFENYGGITPSDYTIEDMRQMFGDAAICQSVSGNVCTPKATALQLNQAVVEAMNGGHCYGMAVTSQRFFKQIDAPGQVQPGATTTYDLQLDYARRNIAYYFVQQFFDPINTYTASSQQKSATTTLSELRETLAASSSELPVIGIHQVVQGQPQGHAITPYAVEDRGNGLYYIYVYDNNLPDDASRILQVNTISNSWSYDMGGNLGVWGGNTPGSFMIMPLALNDGPFVLPSTSASMNASVGVSAASTTSQIWQQGGNILVSDEQGRRIGYIDGQFVNEIPNAYDIRPIGGLGHDSDPVYNLPNAGALTITLDGSSVRTGTSLSVTQFGPEYAVAVTNMTLGTGAKDQLTISADGSQVAYRANQARSANLSLTQDAASTSTEIQIRGLDLAAGQIVTTRMSSTEDLMIDGSNTDGGFYDLSLLQTRSSGLQLFTHSNMTIAAGDTQYIGYNTWDGSGSITVQVDRDSNGSIDETMLLDNQVKHVYLPIVSKPVSTDLSHTP